MLFVRLCLLALYLGGGVRMFKKIAYNPIVKLIFILALAIAIVAGMCAATLLAVARYDFAEDLYTSTLQEVRDKKTEGFISRDLYDTLVNSLYSPNPTLDKSLEEKGFKYSVNINDHRGKTVFIDSIVGDDHYFAKENYQGRLIKTVVIDKSGNEIDNYYSFEYSNQNAYDYNSYMYVRDLDLELDFVKPYNNIDIIKPENLEFSNIVTDNLDEVVPTEEQAAQLETSTTDAPTGTDYSITYGTEILGSFEENTTTSTTIETFSSDEEYEVYSQEVATIDMVALYDYHPADNTMLGFELLVVDLVYLYNSAFMPIILICLAFCVFTAFYLMVTFGQSEKDGEVKLIILDKIPLDFYLLASILAASFFIFSIFVTSNVQYIYDIGTYQGHIEFAIGSYIIGYIATILLFRSIVVRYKNKTLLSNNITTWMLKFVFKPFKLFMRHIDDMSILGKGLIIIVLYLPISLLINAIFPFIIAVEKLMLAGWLIVFLVMLKKVQTGAEEIAKGNINTEISTTDLVGDIKKHANTLNNIREGLSVAVENEIKSERMKTELITNVSHDIKTPLTSIINYIDLISKEETNNPKIVEYTEIVTRNADRLKRLTTDLIDVSKVSTGNVNLELQPCQIDTFISQVVGEYIERFEEKNLELIIELPEEPIFILADSKHIWRVFDNILNNSLKYAQAGTRVYLNTIKVNENEISISLKNISAERLSITPSELTERFVRGDKSRNTEGSGLGLSIATSLVELQNGKMIIDIDGDLFKVTINFNILPD